ncbi:LPS translocon maturation chaperone LptM [Sulfurifustis variabilis]|nr:lipoprotein [Sulfurifustis variabilis]
MPVDRVVIALAVLVVALAACGKKGPLYLPAPAQTSSAAGDAAVPP